MNLPLSIVASGLDARQTPGLEAGLKALAARPPLAPASPPPGPPAADGGEMLAAVALVAAASGDHEAAHPGERTAPAAATHIPRPIDPQQVLRELNALALLRQAGWPCETLPTAMKRRGADGPPAARRRGPRQDAWFSSAQAFAMAVLLVESNPGEFAALQAELQRQGAQAFVCQDLEHDLERACAGEFDLVIVAPGAPGGAWDGLAVCREWRMRLPAPRDGQRTRLALAHAPAADLQSAAAAADIVDAWLPWPAAPAELERWLGQLGLGAAPAAAP